MAKHSRVSFGSHQKHCAAQAEGKPGRTRASWASPYALLSYHTQRMTLRDSLSISVVPDSPQEFPLSQYRSKRKTIFFLILLHCPCCSSKEHKRPLQGTASATTNNNKKCGKLEGFKDAAMACHPPSTALGVRELKKKKITGLLEHLYHRGDR